MVDSPLRTEPTCTDGEAVPFCPAAMATPLWPGTPPRVETRESTAPSSPAPLVREVGPSVNPIPIPLSRLGFWMACCRKELSCSLVTGSLEAVTILGAGDFGGNCDAISCWRVAIEEDTAAGGVAGMAAGLAREDLTRGERPAWGDPWGQWAWRGLERGDKGRAAIGVGCLARSAVFMSAVTARGEGMVTCAVPWGLPGAGASRTGLPPGADPAAVRPWAAALICLARLERTAAAEREEARGEMGAWEGEPAMAWKCGETEELCEGVREEVGGVRGWASGGVEGTRLGVEVREGAGRLGLAEEDEYEIGVWGSEPAPDVTFLVAAISVEQTLNGSEASQRAKNDSTISPFGPSLIS